LVWEFWEPEAVVKEMEAEVEDSFVGELFR
jgi:hypothetical protein